MSEFVVTFNGYKITDYLQVTTLDRGIGTERENNLQEKGLADGKDYQSYRLNEKSIMMGFALRYDLISKRRELAGILNVSEPVRLIFSDEPDKYYMAIPDGDISVDENNFLGFGEINWIIPDGIAHGLDIKEFINLPGNSEIIVTNKGTYDTYPTLETTMLSDNGLVAFINDRGSILQFGNPNEADGHDYQVTDKVINEAMQTQGKWVVGEGELLYKYRNGDPTTPNLKKGSWNWNNTAETIAPIFDSNETMSWAGQPLNINVPLNSNSERTGNFEFKNRFYFTTSIKSFGRLEFNAQNELDNVVGMAVKDSSSSSDNFSVEFWAFGKIIAEKLLSKKQFNGRFFELSITRFGTEITYQFNQIGSMIHEIVTPSQTVVMTHKLEGMKGAPVTSLTIWPARFMNNDVTEIMLADTKFNWINVDKWADLPNLFSKGDELTVDTSSASIYLNGVEMPQIETIGNDWEGFKLMPGQTAITCIQSDWAAMPDCKVSIREAFL